MVTIKTLLLALCASVVLSPAAWSEPLADAAAQSAQICKRAKANMLKSNYKQAIDDYTQAIAVDPSNALAYVNRGCTYNCLGKTEEAFNDYQKAIAIDPKLAIAYYNRASHLRRIGKQTEALQDYTQTIKLEPEYANAYYGRAWSLKLLGRKTEAITDYLKAAEIFEKQKRTPAARDARSRASEL